MTSTCIKYAANIVYYIFGEFLKTGAKTYSRNIYSNVQSIQMSNADKAYFGIPFGDQDKP